jgi:hypothetical protein
LTCPEAYIIVVIIIWQYLSPDCEYLPLYLLIKRRGLPSAFSTYDLLVSQPGLFVSWNSIQWIAGFGFQVAWSPQRLKAHQVVKEASSQDPYQLVEVCCCHSPLRGSMREPDTPEAREAFHPVWVATIACPSS